MGSRVFGTAGTVGGIGGVWWLFRFGLVGLVVGVVGFASHVGAFEFEVTGGSGDAAEGAVGDELAADAHVPLLGFALAGDERGSRAVAGLHDLEDEDAVGGGDRGGQEIVEDEQFHGLELVDLAVVLALAFQPRPVDLLEHVLQPDVAYGCALPAGRVAEGLADVAFAGPGAGDDDQGLPVAYPLACGETFDPVPAELAFGRVVDVLDAGVLVFEPGLAQEPFDLAVAPGRDLRVEHEFDLLLEGHPVVGFVVDDLTELGVADGEDPVPRAGQAGDAVVAVGFGACQLQEFGPVLARQVQDVRAGHVRLFDHRLGVEQAAYRAPGLGADRVGPGLEPLPRPRGPHVAALVGHVGRDGRVLTVRAVETTMGGDLFPVVVGDDLGGGELHVEDASG